MFLAIVERAAVWVRGGDGVADGGAPSLGAVGGDELLLGEAKSLGDGLTDVGEGVGCFGLEVTLGDGAEELAESGGQVAGGDEIVGERGGQVAADSLGGDGL